MEKISQALSAYFKEKGLTQNEIAGQLGVTQQYISGLLSGKTAFGKKQAQKFGELYGISPSWLLTGEGPMLMYDGKNTLRISGHHNSADGAMVGDGNGPGAVLLSEIDFLHKQIEAKDELIRQLQQEKSEYWEMIKRLSAK